MTNPVLSAVFMNKIAWFFRISNTHPQKTGVPDAFPGKLRAAGVSARNGRTAEKKPPAGIRRGTRPFSHGFRLKTLRSPEKRVYYL